MQNFQKESSLITHPATYTPQPPPKSAIFCGVFPDLTELEFEDATKEQNNSGMMVWVYHSKHKYGCNHIDNPSTTVGASILEHVNLWCDISTSSYELLCNLCMYSILHF